MSPGSFALKDHPRAEIIQIEFGFEEYTYKRSDRNFLSLISLVTVTIELPSM